MQYKTDFIHKAGLSQVSFLTFQLVVKLKDRKTIPLWNASTVFFLKYLLSSPVFCLCGK